MMTCIIDERKDTTNKRTPVTLHSFCNLGSTCARAVLKRAAQAPKCWSIRPCIACYWALGHVPLKLALAHQFDNFQFPVYYICRNFFDSCVIPWTCMLCPPPPAQNPRDATALVRLQIYESWSINYTVLPHWQEIHILLLLQNKKLSCRRETARRFVSLNILLSHSRLDNLIRNDTVE